MTPLAGTFDFTIEQGSTFVEQFLWLNDNSNPVPMTGCSGHMQIRNGPLLIEGNADLLYADFTSGKGEIILDPTNGTITWVFTSDQTAALTFTTARYDFHIITPSGAVTRLLQGTVTLSPEITIENPPGLEVLSGGSGPIAVNTVSGNYSMALSDVVVLCDPTSGGFTVTLPTAKGFQDVYVISVKGTSSNLVNVAPQTGETVNGVTGNVVLGAAGSGASYTSITLISDSKGWVII